MALEQLVYISKATFEPQATSGHVEPEVARILVASRKNNRRRHVVGALHYNNGYFFQVLEGETEQLDELFPIIKADPRHSDIKLLGRESIQHSRFEEWSMKYGVHDRDVDRLLKKHGQGEFNPYLFSPPLIADMLALMQTVSGEDDATRLEAARTPAELSGSNSSALSAPTMALGVAVLALIISVIALYQTI